MPVYKHFQNVPPDLVKKGKVNYVGDALFPEIFRMNSIDKISP